MSRRALWPASGPSSPTAPDGGVRAQAAHGPTGPASAEIPSPPPIPAHGAAGRAQGALPARSALAAQVKLARLADALSEAAQIIRELGEVPLAVAREPALMCDVKPERLLTAEDLAARLQVDARTIRRWRKAGRIPAGIEVAGVLRWRAEEIDAWVASGGRT